ncbi:MAG: ATPase, T2SS/T4P/T4SS family, partial [Candidatus Gracilibacteria bacterium]|nr:ATPase, T2SS/T4P/T4SS family [Candidatus Gracilibacteria bacterium]
MSEENQNLTDQKNTTKQAEQLLVDLDQLLDLAIEKDASDIHFGAESKIYLRLSGKLVPVDGVGKLTHEQAERLLFQMLETEEKSQYLKIKELDFSYQHKDGSVFRGNAYFRRRRVAVALRLIPKVIKTMEDLGLPAICQDFIQAPQGLVLITGPTGSGKSTTMAAMLEQINKTQVKHVITIEDPIEYIFESKKCIFSQRELHSDTLSFRHALKSALREDPDIVVISEMRDPETNTAAMM